MFVFENLPIEIIWSIIEYTDYLQSKHRQKFQSVIDMIDTFPKFIKVFSTKICNRRTIFNQFEKDNKIIYTLGYTTYTGYTGYTTYTGYLSFLKETSNEYKR
jgi:hypothetical protein